jgi:serine/threonine protein kinase
MPRSPTHFGRYEIVGPLATGGMADLLLARARGPDGFESLAAIKRIRQHLALDPEFVKLFLGEARLAAQLRHPNIVHVYDAGQDDGEYYFVMEYVHGRDLRALMRASVARKRRLGVDEALAIVVPLLAGLHHAHERLAADGAPLGIVHRDVSPSNVLLSWDGAVKLADFGIAKATRAAGESTTNSPRGKVSYMSPEQCLGQPLDRRSDLYGLSVIFYELLTGDRPHPTQESEFLALKQTVEEPARPPSKLRPDLPAELERILLAGLERKRERRPANARDMQLALERFAVAERLAISSLTVARLVEELFGDELHAWEAAQKRGKALSQHLAETGTVSVDGVRDLPVPVAEALAPSPPAAPSPSLETTSRRWRRRTLLAGAAFTALVITLAIGARPSRVPDPPIAQSPAAPSPAIAPPASASVPPPVAPSQAPVAAPDPEPPPPPLPSARTSPPRVRQHKRSVDDHSRRATRWDPEAPVLPR